MTTSAEPLAFVPLKDYERAGWQRPASFFWLDRVGVLPIADTEFMALAHFCPLALELHERGLRPVAIVQPHMVSHRLLADDGRWRPPYVPMALRCMPFRPGPGDAIEVAPELAENPTDSDQAFEMAGKKGGRSQAFSTIVSLLARIQQSGPRLENAAKTLMALDLVEQIGGLPRDLAGPLYTVRLDSLIALSASRILGLTADSCCPLELATALAFSRRWLAAGAAEASGRPFEPARDSVRRQMFDQHIAEPLDEPLGLDDSPLFSFDDVRERAADSS
jgi:hypothetical protein